MKWWVSPLHQLEITSSLVSGVDALVRAGEIDLSLEAFTGPNPTPHIMRWEVKDLEAESVRSVAIDEYDKWNLLGLQDLEDVDVYFKRSYRPSILEDIPSPMRHKIRPLGLTFGCFSAHSRRLMMRAAVVAFAAGLRHRSKTGIRKALSLLAHNLSQIEGFLSTTDWERVPSDSISDRIVYQSRIWEQEPDPRIDRRDVNKERVSLVRALRREFGDPERIGLIHTAFAEESAPDALLCRKVRRSEYARQLRTSLIAVNTHGLDGSGGFKIGESLAAGCALVSQPFLFETPESLLPEVNYLPFETADECVEQCRRLIEDRTLADKMRDENHQYYLRNIRPEAHARQLLQRVFSTD